MSEHVKVPKCWIESLKVADGNTGIQLVEELQSGKIEVKSDIDGSDWQSFNSKKSINGFFWVAGTYPDVDVDVDSHGQTSCRPNGKSMPYISLAYLEYEPEEGFLEIEPLCPMTWPFEEEYRVDFIKPFDQPDLPKSLIMEAKHD